MQLHTHTNTNKHCKIWGFHGGDYEEWYLLGCYATRATRRNNPEDTILQTNIDRYHIAYVLVVIIRMVIISCMCAHTKKYWRISYSLCIGCDYNNGHHILHVRTHTQKYWWISYSLCIGYDYKNGHHILCVHTPQNLDRHHIADILVVFMQMVVTSPNSWLSCEWVGFYDTQLILQIVCSLSSLVQFHCL
jgi:hypothetical protein